MSLYDNYINQYNTLEISSIADLMLEHEESVSDVKKQSIMRSLRRARNRNDSILIYGTGRRGDDYKISRNSKKYTFNLDGKVIKLKPEAIEELFTWYTEPSSYSIEDCCILLKNHFGYTIVVDEMARILKCLDLTRKVTPVPPHVKALSDKEISDYYMQVISNKTELKLAKEEDSAWKSLYEKERKRTLSLSKEKEAEKEIAEKFELPEIQRMDFDYDLEATELVVMLTDWHVGIKCELEQNIYNKDVFLERIQKLKVEILDYLRSNKRSVSRVNFLALGDIVDGVLSNMHADQLHTQDLRGIAQTSVAAQALADVIYTVKEAAQCAVRVYSVGGNHGRVTPDRTGDPTRYADQAVYEMARLMLESKGVELEWHLNERIVGSFRVGEVQVFYSHGDRTPNDIRDLVWAGMDEGAKKFVYCSGHLHTFMLERTKIILIRGGSLCGGNNFAFEQVGHIADPSQTMFEVRGGDVRGIHYIPVK